MHGWLGAVLWPVLPLTRETGPPASVAEGKIVVVVVVRPVDVCRGLRRPRVLVVLLVMAMLWY